MLRIDVLVDASDIDLRAAVALRSAARYLCWQWQASGPHCFFPGVHRTVAAMFVESAFRDFREQRLPVSLKPRARGFECAGGAVPVLARLEPGIEAAAPAPLIAMDGNAGTFADRANTHIAVVDVPGLAVAISDAATGELGHPALIPPAGGARKSSIPRGWVAMTSTAIAEPALPPAWSRPSVPPSRPSSHGVVAQLLPAAAPPQRRNASDRPSLRDIAGGFGAQ